MNLMVAESSSKCENYIYLEYARRWDQPEAKTHTKIKIGRPILPHAFFQLLKIVQIKEPKFTT